MTQLLLIAKNIGQRKKIVQALEQAHYNVSATSELKSGIKKASIQKPHLVIWDIPQVNLAVKEITSAGDSNHFLKNIPFIFVTGKQADSEFIKLPDIPFIKYCVSPFNGKALICAVEEALSDIKTLQDTSSIQFTDGAADGCSANNFLKNFTKNRDIVQYKKKQVIYAEGGHPGKLFYIEKGKVKIIKTNNDGKELTVQLLNEGDFAGYTALLEGAVYKDTAQAIDDCDIAIIPKEEFEELLQNNREAAQLFIQLLAKSFSEKEEQLLSLAYNSLRKRVADALMTLQTKYSKTSQSLFSMHVSREDLANMAGTATESLIRTLSNFKNEKLIDIKAGNIIILDPKKLQKI